MKDKHYPNYFRASDKASISSQKTYKVMFGIDLLAMIIAAAIAIYNYEQVESKQIVYIFSGGLLLLSLLLTIILKFMKFEDVWYNARAMAESCKTLTWRFMSRSESFESHLSLEEAKSVFLERMDSLKEEFEIYLPKFDSVLLSKEIITEKMVERRKADLQQRIKFYTEKRINEQISWYSGEAEKNKTLYNRWFYSIIGLQALAVISIVFLIASPQSDWNLVGLFTTISASGLSWLQLKQHQELKEAYTIAAVELNHILSKVDSVKTESEFSEFVLDAENAVSREHTTWSAQRRN